MPSPAAPAASPNPLPVKFSFGIIVFNGQPWVPYCLRSLYPYAHQIIVVEGACRSILDRSRDGHSTDGTLEALRDFQAHEDPRHIVELVARDGGWSEKDEMSQAYAQRVTGDYLWQVDIDEFYRGEDLRQVADLLATHPDLDTVSFLQREFWGGFDYYCDGWYLRCEHAEEFHRLWKWRPGYRYVAHRPPTVVDEHGTDLRAKRWVRARSLFRGLGVCLYHYALVLPKQVQEKSAYYQTHQWVHSQGALNWARETYTELRHPFHVENVYTYPSWLLRYQGPHPAAITALRGDLASGRVAVELRPTADIERLLASKRYRFVRRLLILLTPLVSLLLPLAHFVHRAIGKPCRRLFARRRAGN